MTRYFKMLIRRMSLCIAIFSSILGYAQDPTISNTKIPKEVLPALMNENVTFTQNKGQLLDNEGGTLDDVLFTAKSRGQQFYFRPNGISYIFLKRETGSKNIFGTFRMDMELINSNKEVQIEGGEETSYRENHYTSASEITHVRCYEKIVYKNIYPLIDLVYYSKGEDLEYDFVVHPGGNIADIKMKFIGADSLSLSMEGKLKIATPIGSVEEQTPYTFLREKKQLVASSFRLTDGELSFGIGSYDHSETLIIDPIVRVWGTYYGGSLGDLATNIVTDANGSIFITGVTGSANAIATVGAYNPNPPVAQTSFLVKFNSSGVRQWGTYFSGDHIVGADIRNALAVDNCGNVVVVGATTSVTGIATAGTHQTSLNGMDDGFILKFNSDGTRLWGTYFGGSLSDNLYGVKFDLLGNVFVTGTTFSNSNIATASSFKPDLTGVSEAIIAKFGKTGNRIWSSYYGGDYGTSGEDISIDEVGNVIVVGTTASDFGIATNGAHKFTLENFDSFVTKFTNNGSRVWGTYFGGSQDERDCKIDTGPGSSIIIVGTTQSSNGIATAGAFDPNYNAVGESPQDIYVSKFNSNGVQQWGTYYGLQNAEYDPDVVVDDNGNIFIAGTTYSSGSGLATADGFRLTNNGDFTVTDVFIAKFNSNGSRLWGSYYGTDDKNDRAHGIAISNNAIYVVGETSSSTGIATPGSHQPNFAGAPGFSDAFMVKFSDSNLTESHYQLINASTNSAACTGSISIPYFAAGTFNAGNVFTALLSDENGSFDNPLIIGTIASTVSGTINASIPTNILPGQNYKMRIISSSPAVVNCTDAGSINGLTVGIGPNKIHGGAGDFCSSAPAVVILGTTPTFGGNGVYGYFWQWSANGTVWNTIFENTQNYSAPATSSTRYYRRVIFSEGCFHTSNIIGRIVTPTITSNVIGPDYFFCAPTNPPLLSGAVPIGGNSTITYQWETSSDMVNWSDIGAGGTLQNFDPPFILNADKYYRRKAYSGACSFTSNITSVIIGQQIANNVISGGSTFCGSIDPPAITNSTPTGGNGTYSYQWERSTDGISWATVALTKDYDPSSINVTMYFRRRVSSAGCAVTYSNVIVFSKSGNPPAPPIIIASGPTNICVDGSVELSVPIQPGTSYQWRKNGIPIPGATLNKYLVAGNFGSFSVDMTTCTTISSNSVTVNPVDCTIDEENMRHKGEATSAEKASGNTTTEEDGELYPNPATNKLYLDKITGRENAVLQITSLTGKEVYNGSAKKEIDVAHLTSGVYILTLTTSDGVVKQFRFVKK